MIYLDYNSTTPIDKKVVDEILPFLYNMYGNPSCSHTLGIQAKKHIENARNRIAKMLNCSPSEIIFTSGGTESNNYAIKGFTIKNKIKGNHIISQKTEHPAILKVCEYLRTKGFEFTFLNVDKYGMISLNDLKNNIKENTILISIMMANNEIGTIQPIKEIVEIAHKNNITVHSDASQALGKIKIDLKKIKIDLLTVAGHKIYAPKGIGALFIRNNIKLEKLIHGANQEFNKRAGTENTIGIIGLGKACEIIDNEINEDINKFIILRKKLIDIFEKNNLDFIINGHPTKYIKNTLNISFKDISSSQLVNLLANNVAISTGAACHANSNSSILKNINLKKEYLEGTVRISLGRFTTEKEIETAGNIISKMIKKLLQKK